MQAELLIHAQWVLPVDSENRQLTDHAVAIADGRILAVLPYEEAQRSVQAEQVIELPGHALIPGLVNAHTHAAMTLMRGLADDLPLMTWLHDHIWPTEKRWVDEHFVGDGTRLAVLEMLRGGVTCFNDMYFYPEITAQVSAEAGMRAVIGMIVVDFPTGYAESADDYIAKGLALHDQYRDHPLVRVAFAPHSPYAVSDAPLQRIRTLANEMEVPIHLHLHETHDEIVQSLRDHGERPMSRLDRLGLIGPALAAIHMTQLEDDEIERLAETGAHVVHCPESNLKLASGFCPVAKLLSAGVNVALGTDGAASNNDLNLLGEMRTAALLGKGVASSAAAVPAHAALRMATINGAKALGLEDEIGSLEPGKSADLVALDLRDSHTQPLYNPASHLVYAAGRHQVRQVWIQGRQVIKDGVPLTLSTTEVISAAQVWGNRLAEHHKV
ncbi:5-methylthioadenosine/S-adenosylhomocysteine deaminase [Thiorhodococcus drewsii AZ1]|uniref:5-methylthioadenosine/S-adenosylhomocysteine deaminase n=1 Tax=Thiorhodococcus drewsii AZ1 TaxID=765913 RepID=G2DVZ4_9GAMM|nr:TRZ/ATZ family hydrolase [Thiorhodococcus drewsii]EGV33900.1 5-methylthioadenosine/S-adenosylhomocysteine deaminase [Thiorhodococcus drewsii AZ1]